jgi:hypothetical protein
LAKPVIVVLPAARVVMPLTAWAALADWIVVVPRNNEGNLANATVPDVRLVAFAAMAIALL